MNIHSGFLVFALLSGSTILPKTTVPDWGSLQATIQKHLGRPYSLGAVGTRSYDCSGFVWRVFSESGCFMKRTTARKLCVSLPKITSKAQPEPGDLVFFDNMKHVGVLGEGGSFYHAAVLKGTSRAALDGYWKAKVYAYRSICAR